MQCFKSFGVGRVQVHGSLISSDGEADVEPLAINATSAALATSDIPWAGEGGSSTCTVFAQDLHCCVAIPNGVFLQVHESCSTDVY